MSIALTDESFIQKFQTPTARPRRQISASSLVEAPRFFMSDFRPERDLNEAKTTTIEVLRREQRRSKIESLLSNPNFGVFSYGLNEDPPVNKSSVTTAIKLLNELPHYIPLPKVRADEDGDVEYHWSGPINAIVTIEARCIHALFWPNTDRSLHMDSVELAEGGWPREVLSRLSAS